MPVGYSQSTGAERQKVMEAAEVGRVPEGHLRGLDNCPRWGICRSGLGVWADGVS